MEYEHTGSGGTNNKTQCLYSDIITTLPQNIIEKILTHMPIRDALRTSVLSKKWRYSWRSMPKLVFTESMVRVPSICGCKVHSKCGCRQLKKYKLISAIFQVLLFHNGPTILEFDFRVGELGVHSECDQMISYLSSGNNKVKELIFYNHQSFYKLPVPFFSLQALERIELQYCVFEPPASFNRFSCLRRMDFINVKVSAQMLRQFLSKCPLLEYISLDADEEGVDFAAGGSKLTLVDLLQCVPLVHTLEISNYYLKYLCAGGMPHKLPISLVHLKNLYLDVCLMDQNGISSTLSMMRSSPVLVKLTLWMLNNEKLPVQQTPTNFFDPEDYSDLKLDHLEILEIQNFSNLPLEMEFVELIMAKSPVLKRALIKLNASVTADKEMKMLRDLVLLPFPRASPKAKLIFERPKAK